MTPADITAHQAPDAARRKRAATLAAQLALKGHQMVEMPDGTYMVGRWGLAKPLPDIEAVAEFARVVGAAT